MRRFAFGVLVVAALLATHAQTRAHAAVLPCSVSPGHIGVVIEHGNGAVLQRCVGTDAAGASGETVLRSSGIQFATVGYGGALGNALCQVDHEPSTFPPSCFSPRSPYWEIFVLRSGGGWHQSPIGISNVHLDQGDALGLRYETASAPPPPFTANCPTTHATESTRVPTHTAQAVRASARPSHAGATSAATFSLAPAVGPTASVAAVHTLRPLNVTPTEAAGPSAALILAFLVGGGLVGLLIRRLVAR